MATNKVEGTGKYAVFKRCWWKIDKSYPGGRRPHAGRKTYLRHGLTLEEARAFCQEYNRTHEPGPTSIKAEFETE